MDRSEPGCYPENKGEKMCGGDGMSYATVRCDKTQMNRQKPGFPKHMECTAIKCQLRRTDS